MMARLRCVLFRWSSPRLHAALVIIAGQRASMKARAEVSAALRVEVRGLCRENARLRLLVAALQTDIAALQARVESADFRQVAR